MRMWMVNPKLMCRQHLLGEHKEIHMFAGVLKKGTSINGYLKNKLIDTDNLNSRHDELVTEMKARGYNHKTPLKPIHMLPGLGTVSVDKSFMELYRRCPDCRARIKLTEPKTVYLSEPVTVNNFQAFTKLGTIIDTPTIELYKG